MAANYSQDQALIAALDGDLHTQTDGALFGRSDPAWRVLAKNANFGILYGAGPKKLAEFVMKADNTISERMAVTRAAGMLEDHRRMFPMLHHLNDELQKEARKRGDLPLPVPGRYRHFRSPNCQVSYHTALNAIVQGGVAELMKSVMVGLLGYGPFPVLQVHDALVFELYPGCNQDVLDRLDLLTQDLGMFTAPPMEWEMKQWT